RRLSPLLFLAFIGGSIAAGQPPSVVDDRGKRITLPRPAQRIVTLAPHLTELTFSAGAGGHVVGVARYSDFPSQARDLPNIGDSALMDFEQIVALKPDLVLAWRSGNAPADVERIEQLGFPVFVSEAARLADLPRVTRAIGTLAGTLPEAAHAAAQFEKDIRTLRERHAHATRLRVFYLVWRKPFMTVGGSHLISDVIALCGGQNVFAGMRQLAPVVTLEAIIAAKPEAVLGGSGPGTGTTFESEWRAAAPEPLSALPAFYVNPDLIQRPTLRMAEGASAVCSALDRVRKSMTGETGKEPHGRSGKAR
ncbi:MAG TPA: cobalamin-binding protein, partial [Burkholderiales bacterium]|nr:cobalamin-binding protein [Burkholderiales bacterium]